MWKNLDRMRGGGIIKLDRSEESMKKWKKILGIVVLGVFSLTACSNNTSEPNSTIEPTHEHTFSTDWSKNETKHWHEANCGDDVKKDEAEHTFGDWQDRKSTRLNSSH